MDCLSSRFMAVNMHAESSIRSGPVTGDGIVGFGKESLLFRLIAAWGIFFEFHDGRIEGKLPGEGSSANYRKRI